MSKKQQKFYVVWNGRQRGIYTSWAECEKQVKGFQGAKFKSFPTKAEAEQAFQAGKSNSVKAIKKDRFHTDTDEVIWDSVSVDVGCRGNPGIVEYKGVHTKTGEVLFSHDEIHIGTNNMGEFLAIVHALAYLKKQNKTIPVYSDSETAMKWVKAKKAKSTLKRDSETEYIWTLVERAEAWLQNNTYLNPILKWRTEKWGEIKADYGRK
ncbi:ribonuclease H family protein [Alkalihalobacillus sp. LMS39]|uniref:ribonuclease H n=1 Tax=Alkalihalobacillus sp. LMS39 TaxID=2924032 RepID=UPI001FB4A734|nr:ribonuclease H family protein [Alkalihalobacillus sp. LMS39]UOE94612.1 ribonuclease H family protein [Alkalihalobacillus sp. LMS39]